MAKVKVQVTNAVVSGKKSGEMLIVEESEAKHLESIGYVKRIATKKTEGLSNKSL